MNALHPESPRACEHFDAPQDESNDPSNVPSAQADQSHSAGDTTGIDEEASPSAEAGSDEESRNPEGVDTSKVQHALDNLVRRIGEARSRGAAGGAYGANLFTHGSADIQSQSAQSAVHAAGISENDWQRAARGQAEPETVPSERRTAALELRMRQIAELVGTPLAEDVSADIADLRSRMDRLSRADGTLSSKMESIQSELSGLRETMDTSTAPVIDRLVELEARFDEIAAVRSQIEQLPTAESLEGLEKGIHLVSGQLSDVVNQRENNERLAILERRVLEVSMATKTAVEEIRQRPAYDPTDVRTLLQRVETWRRENNQSALPAVGAKLDTIARQVDQLSKSDNRSALSQIQQRLGEISTLVSTQNANFSGLDLAGLQARLTRICDELAKARSDRRFGFDKSTPPAKEPEKDAVQHHEDDEDHILAKRLAVRFAPEANPAPGIKKAAAEGSTTDDVAGAFDAVQDALESLVGQIPFLERTWEGADQKTGSQRSAAAGTPAKAGPVREPTRELRGVSEPGGEERSKAESSPGDPPIADKGLSPGTKAYNVTPLQDVSNAETRAYADAAHRIGRYSTWRKAKVAVVAANPPKY